MRAWITQDGLDNDWQGYAWVIVELDPEDATSFAASDSVSLGYFGSDGQQYLSRNGAPKWVGNPEPLVSQEQPTADGNGRQYLLQPGYIDDLLDGIYDVLLLDANGQPKAATKAEFFNIVFAPLADKNIVGADSVNPEVPLADKAIMGQGPEGQAASWVQDGPGMADAYQTAAPSAEPAENSEVAQPGVEAQAFQPGAGEAYYTSPAASADAPVKKKSRLWLWLFILIILASAAGGAGYFFYNQHMEEEARLAAERQAAEEARAEAERQAAEAAAKAEAERQAAEEAARAEAERQAAEAAAKAEAERQAAEEAARAEAERQAAEEAARRDTPARVAEFFAGERDPAKAMELAAQLPSDTDEQKDSLFRLYYYAAESGNPDGALKYAECVDPTTPAWGSISKNGADAYHYYGESPNGQEQQAKVRSWIEEYARRGNAAARQWLQEIQ